MKKIILLLTGLFTTMVALVGVTAASAAPAHNRIPHLAIHASETVVKGITHCSYWTTNKGGVAAVVRTVNSPNCSPTASFTIKAPPYDGEKFSPDSGASAFENYLGQIGEFINPYPYIVSGGPNVHGMKMLGYPDNVYTNKVRVYIYQGPGNDGCAQLLRNLLTVGCPFGAGECTS